MMYTAESLSSVVPQHRCDIKFEKNNNKSLHSINESERKSIKITLADISLKKNFRRLLIGFFFHRTRRNREK